MPFTTVTLIETALAPGGTNGAMSKIRCCPADNAGKGAPGFLVSRTRVGTTCTATVPGEAPAPDSAAVVPPNASIATTAAIIHR